MDDLYPSMVPRSRIAAMEDELTAVEAKLAQVQADAGAEIERLTLKLGESEKRFSQCCADYAALEVDKGALENRLGTVKSAFVRYAQHLPECDLDSGEHPDNECSCGFSEAFAKIAPDVLRAVEGQKP